MSRMNAWLLTGTAALAGAVLGIALRHGEPVGSAQNHPGASGEPQSPLGQTGRPMNPRLASMLAAGIPSLQAVAALDFEDITSTAEIRDLLENARLFPPNASARTAISALLKRWLELNPLEAVNYCRRSSPEYLQATVASWGQMEPEAAEEWVKSMPSNYGSTGVWSALCDSIAVQNPEKAWKMLEETPGLSNYLSTLLDAPLRQLVGQDVNKAMALLDSMPPALQEPARNAVFRKLFAENPSHAWDWLRQQPGVREPFPGTQEAADAAQETRVHQGITELNNTAKAVALGEAFRSDPAEVLRLIKYGSGEEFATELTIDPPWQIRNGAAVAQLLREDPDFSQEKRESLVSVLFGSTFERDPAAVRDFFTLMSAEDQQKNIGNFLNAWSRDDRAAAGDWVQSLSADPVRTAAEAALAGIDSPVPAADRSSPDSLMDDLKQSLPIDASDPRYRKLTVSGLDALIHASPSGDPSMVANLGTANPDVGAAWLAGATMDQQTERAAALFASNWAAGDPAAAAAWAKSLPPGNLAETAALNAAVKYRRYAPAEAEAWLNSLVPSVRDSVRKTLRIP